MNKLHCIWFDRKYLFGRKCENFLRALARRLPKRIQLYIYCDVVAVATTGKYGNTVVPEITAVDVLKRWSDEVGIK